MAGDHSLASELDAFGRSRGRSSPVAKGFSPSYRPALEGSRGDELIAILHGSPRGRGLVEARAVEDDLDVVAELADARAKLTEGERALHAQAFALLFVAVGTHEYGAAVFELAEGLRWLDSHRVRHRPRGGAKVVPLHTVADIDGGCRSRPRLEIDPTSESVEAVRDRASRALRCGNVCAAPPGARRPNAHELRLGEPPSS